MTFLCVWITGICIVLVIAELVLRWLDRWDESTQRKDEK
jgi:hypothetical protein